MSLNSGGDNRLNQPLPERATERRAGENRVAISEKTGNPAPLLLVAVALALDGLLA